MQLAFVPFDCSIFFIQMDESAHKNKIDEIPSQIVDQAIDWIIKLEADDATHTAHHTCETWRASDPLHERAWQALQQIEQTFRLAPSIPPTLVLETLEVARKHRSKVNKKHRRQMLKVLGLGAISMATGWSIYEQLPWHHWAKGIGADYKTAKGERRTINLSDGSQLILNTATQVNVQFTAKERSIWLREGEIFVRTGKKTRVDTDNWPFLVVTKHGRFKAIGTQFFIRQKEDQTRLRVQEGAIAITTVADLPSIIAQANQEYLISPNGGVQLDESHFDMTGWANGVLIANEMRLIDFLAELSRYRTGWLLCDPAVMDLTISGVFQLIDIDRIFEVITHTLPVKIIRLSRYWTKVSPA